MGASPWELQAVGGSVHGFAEGVLGGVVLGVEAVGDPVGMLGESQLMPGVVCFDAGGQFGCKGPRYNVDIAAALALQELGSGIKIEMREQVEVMSGSKVEFTSGEVVEDVTFVAQPNTEQLVSQITRRTVGLVLRLRATVAESSWHLALELEDGSLAGGTERNTKWTGERFVTPDTGFFLLGSFTRKTTTTNRQGVPLLRQAPWIGPIFGKSVTNLVNRQLMLLARPMSKVGVRVGSSADDSRKVVSPSSAPAVPADSTSKGRVYGPVPGPSPF